MGIEEAIWPLFGVRFRLLLFSPKSEILFVEEAFPDMRFTCLVWFDRFLGWLSMTRKHAAPEVKPSLLKLKRTEHALDPCCKQLLKWSPCLNYIVLVGQRKRSSRMDPSRGGCMLVHCKAKGSDCRSFARRI